MAGRQRSLLPLSALWLRPQQGNQMWLFGIYKDIQYFILKANSRGQHNYPYLTGKETEAQREDMSGAAGPRPAPLRSQGQVTWVVAAAPRGAPPPPGALVQGGVPVAEPLALERVGRQVADLQAGELTHEVSEGHPGGVEVRGEPGPPARALRDVARLGLGGLGAGVPVPKTEEGAAHQNSPSSILTRSCSRT